jgi:hypothetical protein
MKLITGRALYTGYTALTREEKKTVKNAQWPLAYIADPSVKLQISKNAVT